MAFRSFMFLHFLSLGCFLAAHATSDCSEKQGCSFETDPQVLLQSVVRVHDKGTGIRANCNSFTDEASCAASEDPVCGWAQNQCTEKFDKVEVGGASSAWIHGKVISRPQFRTMEHKKNGAWEGCGGADNCWTGYDMVGNIPASVKGSLSDAAYTIAAFELLVDCEISTKIVMSFRKSWNENVQYKLSYNNQEYDTDIVSGHMLKVSINIKNTDEYPILRLEASRIVETENAAYGVTPSIKKVEASFEKCMELKKQHSMCLSKVPQTAVLRSDHGVQEACLDGSDTTSASCNDWLDCLDADAEATLLKMLKALSQSSTALLQAGRANCKDGDHFDCHNPSSLDIEAYDCDCLDWAKDATQAVINQRACDHVDVCCSWKEDHCSDFTADPQLLQRSNESQQRESDNEGSLDESLVGKRSC